MNPTKPVTPVVAIPSPNTWHRLDVYELENRAVDPDRLIEAAMAALHDWSGQRVLGVRRRRSCPLGVLLRSRL